MKPNEIRSELVLLGVTLQSIATSLDVSKQHVWQVVNGHRRNPRVQSAVAKALGRTLERVFPFEVPHVASQD